MLPWLAAEKPTLFNAYQQTQNSKLEPVMQALVGAGYIASFIGQDARRALFVGLYAIRGAKPLTRDEYWQVPAYAEMKQFGMRGWQAGDARQSILWFDLELLPFYREWAGKLIVGWPPPERSWWRRAHRNDIPVEAILEDSSLTSAMPDWTEVEFGWADLAALPSRWRAALAQWRGIYFIFDQSDAKGYVGSACGEANILGRWLNYAARGDGGNVLLRGREPRNFWFTILQRVSPDMESADVVRLETSWKQRLHTRAPFGLNDN